MRDAIRITVGARLVTATNGRLTLEYDTKSGRARLADRVTGQFLDGFGAEAVWEDADTTVVVGPDGGPAARTAAPRTTPLKNGLGTGTRLTFTHDTPAGALRRHFDLYEGAAFAVVSIEIAGRTAGEVISSRRLTPIAFDIARGGTCSVQGPGARALFVPFDNDKFVRYGVHWLNTRYTSCEVTALFNSLTRAGIVLGSITHDLWKTGIEIDGDFDGGERLRTLRVFGGLAEEGLTRDTRPHGAVSGTTVLSPRIFVGFYADWRDGMEAYGRANAAVAPALPWKGGPPFGWNSWAAVGEKVDRTACIAASDFLAKELTPAGFAGQAGAVTVNFDAFWDFLPEKDLLDCVAHVHQNGQRVGIYWTPFSFWGDDLERKVEGTEGRYIARDILLKDEKGAPLPKLNNGWPVDPTHPGAISRMNWQFDRFVRWGFDYVKLDFLNHGSLEGAHADPAVTTGIAAYNAGMRRIRERFAPERVGRPFFISLSIAPTFPHGYAHARRISCDAFGRKDDSEYMLNSLTFGWWLHGTAYAYNDPDHVVLYRHTGHDPTSETEAKMRATSALIAGTVLLDSDDLRDPLAQARARRLLTNRDALAVARTGRTFRPVEFDTDFHAAGTFVRREPDGSAHVALFNFSDRAVDRTIPLSTLGLDAQRSWRARDLWTGDTVSPDKEAVLRVRLEAGDARLMHLTPA